jgi:folate-binding protein YgfZ
MHTPNSEYSHCIGQTMPEFYQIFLEERGLITIGGPDRRSFLQGLISNDIERAGPHRAIWAALLTAQGKYLHDFFIIEVGDVFYLDCEAERLMDLGQRLSRFKLRADIDLGMAQDFGVWAGYGDGALSSVGLSADPGIAEAIGDGVVYCDPRLPDIGVRAILPKSPGAGILEGLGAVPGDREGFEALRISLGLPDGSRDMIVEKSILLENNFDSLHGVDWNKGCYVGQELTARTKYRGLIKKRLLPVAFEGVPPKAGAIVSAGGREAGEIRTVSGGMGLALLRLEFVEEAEHGGAGLESDGSALTPCPPYWYAPNK